jgi:hypothetical protein
MNMLDCIDDFDEFNFGHEPVCKSFFFLDEPLFPFLLVNVVVEPLLIFLFSFFFFCSRGLCFSLTSELLPVCLFYLQVL